MTDTPPVDETLAAAFAEAMTSGELAGLKPRFEAIDTSVPEVRWSPAADGLEEPVLRTLLAYWQGLPAGPRAPLAAGVNPLEMREALGFVMLMDAVDGGRDWRYRVYGTGIAARSGFDATGRLVTDAPFAPLTEFFLASYRACAARVEPVFIRHAPPVRVHVVSWDRVILPLDDGEGGIARLLVGNVPRGRRE